MLGCWIRRALSCFIKSFSDSTWNKDGLQHDWVLGKKKVGHAYRPLQCAQPSPIGLPLVTSLFAQDLSIAISFGNLHWDSDMWYIYMICDMSWYQDLYNLLKFRCSTPSMDFPSKSWPMQFSFAKINGQGLLPCPPTLRKPQGKCHKNRISVSKCHEHSIQLRRNPLKIRNHLKSQDNPSKISSDPEISPFLVVQTPWSPPRAWRTPRRSSSAPPRRSCRWSNARSCAARWRSWKRSSGEAMRICRYFDGIFRRDFDGDI